MTLVLTTYDWVPEFPRGFVRDIRVRWLLEELGRPYQVETVPVREKSPDHIANQPFAQVPFIRDGDLTLFESGAILLHLAEGTDLMPEDLRPQVQQWLIAALNSVEPFIMAWAINKFFDKDEAGAARREPLLHQRLAQLQAALGNRDWLTGDSFTVADLLMADILRIPAQNGFLDDLHGLAAYTERATARPGFRKALADQMAHWRAADERQATA
ncbi:glutathione S-transferase family protein [Paracoccus benzoatiresistens]|uniref:Glutathione S-transferase family protein n=1 Tax=Paracoccus benzoatiresistens TaxID=2997341 RepID=A0ABT4J0L3_9RHOB|nr:glutathione S-transferase family protein [Paracoccus sp. EF6]MCZ0960429.1 glutathione S-transferase family protein [Paracoccus sp. EF6]